MKTIISSLMIVLIALGGCRATEPPAVIATSGAVHALLGGSNASQADLALTYAEIASRTNNLQARFDDLEAEDRARRNQEAIRGGVLGAAMMMVAPSLASGGTRGGMSPQMLSAGLNVAGGLASAEASSVALQSFTDMNAIFQRISALQAASAQKGCLA